MNIFGDRYMKYWYLAAILIIIGMIISSINDSSIKSYDLTIFKPDGSVDRKENIMAKTVPQDNLDQLPVSKAFVPKKKL